jgi:hypothetical protein
MAKTPSTAPRLVVAALVGVLAVGSAAAVFVIARGESGSAPQATDPSQCRGLEAARARACYLRAFTVIVEAQDDPRPALETIADSAWSESGFLLTNCHGIMHTVGRTYAARAGVTVSTLMDHLPRSNDPGCTAGFAHGLVTGVAPDIDPTRADRAATVCGNAGTRYQRYSCTHGFGHAFMRLNDDRLAPALDLCRSLGARAAPDCAQGAYHDYWFAVVGADDATLPDEAVTDPRELCGSQPSVFVRPCWYRAFVDNRPEGVRVASPSDLESLCAGLEELHREACVTAASVIGPPEPALQLELCAGLADPSDAESCVRGTKVQNLLGYPSDAFLDLIGRCELVRAARAACYRWLGKTLAVLTDGAFEEAGCPRLRASAARRQCRAGARTMDEALVTFS